MFENRAYRINAKRKGLTPFRITVKETDLHIQADSDLSRNAIKAVLRYRGYLESYIARQPGFVSSMVPLPMLTPAPKIVSEMIDAARETNVGPMAAVAGAIAEFTCRDLLSESKEVIVENGGDIFMKINSDAVFSIYAGESPLSMKTGIRLKKKETPFALCTSSGTLGHSKSFGRADAATIVSDSCALADAAATLLGNMVQKKSDIEMAIEHGKTINGVQGIIIIKGKSMGIWGDLELVGL